MAVREVWGADHAEVLRAAAACCDAELGAGGRPDRGDPTELALLADARLRGIERAAIEAAAPRRAVAPFDAERRRMSIRRADGVLYVKGAPEEVLPRLAGPAELARRAQAEMAARGLRVLAVAVGHGEEERDLDLVGLVGLADPPRRDAIEAIAAARAAGIATIMITGDHPETARAIAREMGLLAPGEDPAARVVARAAPEDKLRLIRDLAARGEVVAMTGDGVNDAPALRAADVGIAMGRTGTEVTREAADVVLTDDDFADVVAAVREGRGVHDNVRKTLVYLLAGNAGELLVVLLAGLAGLPVPLLPLQLLWINLVTDGLPALALIVEPPAPDVLRRPPRGPREPLLGPREWRTIAATGALEAAIALGVFAWAREARGLEAARGLTFSVLVACEVLRAFAARSPRATHVELGAFGDLRLVAGGAATLALQVGLHHLPATRALFGLAPLAARDAAWILGLGLVPVTALELAKLVRRRRG
jgi:Ca2+-transporting ATPase